ncbi:MAG TPA: sigma-70 family RNA polymerase sigma factor [Thermomicrobiales bacterium]|nr:sigma-70 family RNA polymerase sigma factor [Thermomicrobiales bacterium]
MGESSRTSTTELLNTIDDDPGALDRVLPVVYEELREMAHRKLVRERDAHTLNTTDLVHESYLKLVDDARVTERGKAYFFAAASRAMRQVLVDYARRRNAMKRGSGRKPLSLDEREIAVDMLAGELIDLDDALERLAEVNPRQVQVVECRFFGGLSVEETAQALGVSTRTVKYDWAFARAWLFDELNM